MSQDEVLKMVMESLREIKAELIDIKAEQQKSAVSIAMLETMQKAIDSLNLNGRLCKLENAVSSSKGGIAALIQSGPIVISLIAVIVAIWTGVKH